MDSIISLKSELNFARNFLWMCLLLAHAMILQTVFAETISKEPELFDLLDDDLALNVVSENGGLQKTASDNVINNDRSRSIAVSTSNDQAKQSRPQRINKDLLLAQLPTTSPERQLWKARISASEPNKSNGAKDELAQLIKKISDVDLRPQTKEATPSMSSRPNEPEQVNETPKPQTTDTPEEKPVQQTAQAGSISEKTILMIRERLTRKDGLNDPLGLGELLFESGYYKDAAACYRRALEQISVDRVGSLENNAWILFQLGNCVKKDDPAVAIEYYEQVVVDYSGSRWMPLAKVKSEWVRWQLDSQLETLLQKTASEK